MCRHRRTHEAPLDGQPAPVGSEDDYDAEEQEFGSIDEVSPEDSFLPPSMDLNPMSTGTGPAGLNLHMQSGMSGMDFSHGMIQPQLLQQQI